MTINRREFLKISGAASAGLAIPRLLRAQAQSTGENNKPNILILVFDAWSAANISLFGYPRKTTPNLDRLAENALVFHNHHSTGKFTTPGTAGLLTGTHSWAHKAIGFSDPVIPEYADKNIFRVLPDYNRIAYTHNSLANVLLQQFMADIDGYIPLEHLYLTSDKALTTLFTNDLDTATIGWNRSLKTHEEKEAAYSLFLSTVYQDVQNQKVESINKLAESFPLGLPNIAKTNYFLLEDGIDYLATEVSNSIDPYLAYFHFFPPHEPYNTRSDFYNAYLNDGYQPIRKPLHPLTKGFSYEVSNEFRRAYDEFILYADAEFSRLFQKLDASGVLENTWLILTSDHGEIFERGFKGHINTNLFQPAIHIPLVIFPPGKKGRTDIYTPTSAVDILPTICALSGNPLPAWTEGNVLPGIGQDQNASNPVYAFDVTGVDDASGAANKGRAVIIEDNLKVLLSFGDSKLEAMGGKLVEMYDLNEDPEELNNIYPSQKVRGDQLLDTLAQKIAKFGEGTRYQPSNK